MFQGCACSDLGVSSNRMASDEMKLRDVWRGCRLMFREPCNFGNAFVDGFYFFRWGVGGRSGELGVSCLGMYVQLVGLPLLILGCIVPWSF